jgi:uncharacterized membrane protein
MMMEVAVKRIIFLNPPGIIEGILISILLVIVAYATLKSMQGLDSIKKKIIIALLYLASFSMILLMLLNPALKVENYRAEKPTLAVLIDNSWSMNLPFGADGVSRIEKVRDYISNNKAFISDIEKKFLVKYYTFDDSLHASSLDYVNSTDPDGSNTNIVKSIEELVADQAPNKVDSVIIFSDGAENGGLKGIPESFPRDINFKISTVFASDKGNLPDLWIDNVKSTDVAFIRYPIHIGVTVKSIGFGGMPIPLALKEGERVISIKDILIDSSSGQGVVDFLVTPNSLGRKVYTVSIPRVEGDFIQQNNQLSFVCDVIINKIRVLHISGSPSWDVRFLRKALKRNPNIDLVSFFILREATDLVFAPQDDLSLIPFPATEIFGKDLDSFDVVIFQNFDFRPYGIFGTQLENLKNFVVRDGGGFLIIGGGNSFNSIDYESSAIADILPVKLGYSSGGDNSSFDDREFLTDLTEVGIRHPILRIIPNEYDNEKNWMQLPGLEGLNSVRELKSRAIPLITTQGGEPLLVIQQLSEGKVATFLSDSSWKWGFMGAGEGNISAYYERFWNRLLLWLIDDPELREIRLKTDKSSYTVGEKPNIDVLKTNDLQKDDTIKVTMVTPDGRDVRLDVKSVSSDTLNSRPHVEENGIYTIKARIEREDNSVEKDISAQTVFVVGPPENEIKGPTTNEALLRLLADKTGGESITLSDDPERLGIESTPIKKITGYRTEELWDKYWIFILLVLLLASEWTLRRKWGLK